MLAHSRNGGCPIDGKNGGDDGELDLQKIMLDFPSLMNDFPPLPVPDNGTASGCIDPIVGPKPSSISPPFGPLGGGSPANMTPVLCGKCEIAACSRCLDCGDVLCDACLGVHRANPLHADHCVVALLGGSPPISHQSSSSRESNPVGATDKRTAICDLHFEDLRYVCDSCKKVVCQECTLWEHKDHDYAPIANVVSGAKDKIHAILESGRLGKQYIKTSIDTALAYSHAVDREAAEMGTRVRKSMRHFVAAAEERERVLMERVERFRVKRLSQLSDQMAGLRAALSGIAQTSDMLTKFLCAAPPENGSVDLAMALARSEYQMKEFATMYRNLQPKEETITFVPPNFELLQEIRAQGDIVFAELKQTSAIGGMMAEGGAVGNGMMLKPGGCGAGLIKSQCIPGSPFRVVAKPSLGLTTSFGVDGQDDGQVSRPWGVCTDRDGNILVADRRNHRVQVFYMDGSFKLRFGSKGSADGQFDLPAGISTDTANRIVVVDKDNHRVQIFSSNGAFILKFGSYGKECGQFQYPWDVCINSRSEMLITDSRNHRIQLFNPYGIFISRLSFDGVNHSRFLKGLTTPRGACFMPNGDIIVSDFENHRLLLIDASLTKVITTKGNEGSSVQDFSRPSGICCDDDGKVIVADSKNKRVIVFSPQIEFLWAVEIRPSTGNVMMEALEEKDRPSDVALLPDGRLVVMVETSPDSRDQCCPQKTFIQIY